MLLVPSKANLTSSESLTSPRLSHLFVLRLLPALAPIRLTVLERPTARALVGARLATDAPIAAGKQDAPQAHGRQCAAAQHAQREGHHSRLVPHGVGVEGRQAVVCRRDAQGWQSVGSFGVIGVGGCGCDCGVCVSWGGVVGAVVRWFVRTLFGEAR